jgi:hypothetical protein
MWRTLLPLGQQLSSNAGSSRRAEHNTGPALPQGANHPDARLLHSCVPSGTTRLARRRPHRDRATLIRLGLMTTPPKVKRAIASRNELRPESR